MGTQVKSTARMFLGMPSGQQTLCRKTIVPFMPLKKAPFWEYLGAHGAHQLGFELALEEINYERIVSHLVPLPRLVCNHLRQQTERER